MSLRRLHKHARREIKCSGLLLGREKPVFWIFFTFSSFKRQRLSIALFFSSFVLSTSLDSLERTKLNEITEGPKKKKNPFQCLALLASLLVNNFCYILQTGRLFPTRGFAGGFVYNPEEQQFAIKKKKIEQQQKKSSKNKTKQTKQKQREDVYVRQTKKINSTSTKNVAFT